jgi:diguanylate cyclase (GGDEF)-like protein
MSIAFPLLAEPLQLDGLLEREALNAALDAAAATARSAAAPMALLTLDLDHFKDFCDQADPERASAVLRQLAELLLQHKPAQASAVHLGADEFALLLPGLDLTAAAALAEQLRSAVAQAFAALERPLTITLGVAATPAGQDWRAQELLALADARMTFAKRRLQPHHNLVWAGTLPSDWYQRLAIAPASWPAL